MPAEMKFIGMPQTITDDVGIEVVDASRRARAQALPRLAAEAAASKYQQYRCRATAASLYYMMIKQRSAFR